MSAADCVQDTGESNGFRLRTCGAGIVCAFVMRCDVGETMLHMYEATGAGERRGGRLAGAIRVRLSSADRRGYRRTFCSCSSSIQLLQKGKRECFAVHSTLHCGLGAEPRRGPFESLEKRERMEKRGMSHESLPLLVFH